MTAPTCICCARPMADSAYACVRCGITRPAEQLTQISDMVPAARDVAYGQTRRGGGGGSGKPGSRSPGNDDAMDVLAAVGNALTTIAREIADIRGIDLPNLTEGA